MGKRLHHLGAATFTECSAHVVQRSFLASCNAGVLESAVGERLLANSVLSLTKPGRVVPQSRVRRRASLTGRAAV